MAASCADESRAPVAAATATDPGLDEMLREAGFTITAAGKARWRERLAIPIPAEALAEGRRMLDRARGTAA
jgi:hypothetical protein